MATSEFGFTLPQVEEDILNYHRLLASSSRSDPDRPTLLLRLAGLRTQRNKFSNEKSDLDKSIIHLTEAILLPLQLSQHVVHMFFQLASVLFSRFNIHKQPQDLKYSIIYFRFLRINFHPIEDFDIPYGQFTSCLIQALAEKSMLESWLGFGEMIQDRDMDEMTNLTRELLSSDVSASNLIDAIVSLSAAVSSTLPLSDVDLRRLDQVFQVLREAAMIIPDWRVSYALASCLADRFHTTHVINDYEEAIAIADKIVAGHSPGDSLTTTQTGAIHLIILLVLSRSNSYSNPEYLEDGIDRLRTLLHFPSLPDQDRADLVAALDNYEQLRFSYFGVSGDSGEIPSDTSKSFLPYFLAERWAPCQRGVGPEGDPGSKMVEKANHLNKILNAILDGEIMDVEAAVEHGRTFLPLQHSNHRLSYFPASVFAEIIFQAHQRTNRLDYLDEAITVFRHLRNLPAPKVIHFRVGERFLQSLTARHNFFHRGQDFEEAMQLFPAVVNDGSGEVFNRLKISYDWAHSARLRVHASLSTAYVTAMSLMHETLVFSPTFQTQHFRLTNALREVEKLPSDYASYQIEVGQFQQAIETLERGRALLFSEIRGLRIPTNQLCAANPALAYKLADINGRLESVMMSIAQSDSEEIPGDREGMNSIGRLVVTQRKLLEERSTLICLIQSFPGFENFLRPPPFDVLNSAAAHGPVIIINQSEWRSDIIILHKNFPPSVIFTPSDFHDRANQLKDRLLRVRKEKGLDSWDYSDTLASVLADLYELVGKPVIERLHQLEVPEKSRIWWCPTSAFCSLPLHAMGPIPSDDGDAVYFLDLYITSYTTTLSALIESRRPRPFSENFNKPSLLLVAQPVAGGWDEINTVIQTAETPVTTLVSEAATPKTVVECLRDHQFVHFICDGFLEAGRPFDAAFELHGDNLTLLDIIRCRFPDAELAFLSFNHTAELTEGSIANEGLHLVAGMQSSGFRSVVGTMWAMVESDGVDLSKRFYQSIFSERAGQNQVPYYERSARALQVAVKKLRKKRGVTLERWVTFVHYGA